MTVLKHLFVARLSPYQRSPQLLLLVRPIIVPFLWPSSPPNPLPTISGVNVNVLLSGMQRRCLRAIQCTPQPTRTPFRFLHPTRVGILLANTTVVAFLSRLRQPEEFAGYLTTVRHTLLHVACNAIVYIPYQSCLVVKYCNHWESFLFSTQYNGLSDQQAQVPNCSYCSGCFRAAYMNGFRCLRLLLILASSRLSNTHPIPFSAAGSAH